MPGLVWPHVCVCVLLCSESVGGCRLIVNVQLFA